MGHVSHLGRQIYPQTYNPWGVDQIIGQRVKNLADTRYNKVFGREKKSSWELL